MQDIYKKIINKPTVDEVYYNYFTRYVSAFITNIISKTNLTPNFVSYIMFLVGLVAIYFLSLDSTISILYSSLLFIIHNILDTVDGDLARLKSKTSKFGKFIDQITHAIINPSIFFALFFRFKNETDYEIFFILCGFIFLIDMYLKKNFEILTNNRYSFSINKKNRSTKPILKSSFLKFFNDSFFSIIGFFHVLLLIFFVEYFYLAELSFIYFCLFALAVPVKFLIRLSVMVKILHSLKN